MTEQSGVAVCAGEPRLKYPLGSEVQLKSVPGFGYSVIAAVKNERSLMALDGSCLGMALVHEIEPYCDIDQAHFVSKASKVLWELGAKDASEIAATALYKAGARFPDANPSDADEVPDMQVASAVADTAWDLMRAHNKSFKVPTGYDRRQYIIDQWHRNNPRYLEEVETAINIVNNILAPGAREAVCAIYPRPDEEI